MRTMSTPERLVYAAAQAAALEHETLVVPTAQKLLALARIPRTPGWQEDRSLDGTVAKLAEIYRQGFVSARM